MSKTQRRHRQPREEGRLHRFLRTYRFEIIWAAVVALGIFLIFEQMHIRATAIRWLRATAATLFRGAGRLEQFTASLLARTTFSDLVGFALILAALAALLWRIRWRMLRSPALTTLRCPKCGGAIHRVHRRWHDRLISFYVPVRRYRCADGQCHWQGRRVDTTHGPARPPAADRQSQAEP